MVSNASLYFRITESISSQHHLKTPSTPVTPVPSIMSLVRLNGTCQSWHVMSYDMKNEEHDNTIERPDTPEATLKDQTYWNLTGPPIRYSPRGRVPSTQSRTPALRVKGTTYLM